MSKDRKSLNYLCKPLPTVSDLREVRRELAEFNKIYEGYMAGMVDAKTFVRARRRLDDLCVLVEGARRRMRKNRLKSV